VFAVEYDALTFCSGSSLIIQAVGTVFETIEEGAYVELQVKYGLIRLVNTRADLCEQIKNVDLECPIEKGLITITKSVDLPKEIPPVRYSSPSLGLRRSSRADFMSYRANTPFSEMSLLRVVTTSPA
jgi:hypothetical protein